MAEPNYISPQERLKQHYKKQAQKGANAVTKGTDKFAKDYLFPAANLTPVLGDAMDVKQAATDLGEGNYGSAALFGAAAMLPFIGGKAIKKAWDMPKEAVVQATDKAVTKIAKPLIPKMSNTFLEKVKPFAGKYKNDINEVLKKRNAKTAFKAKEEGIKYVKDWFSHPETDKRILDVIASEEEIVQQAINNTRINRGIPREDATRYINDELFLKYNDNPRNEEFINNHYVDDDNPYRIYNLDRGHLVPKKRLPENANGASSSVGHYHIDRNLDPDQIRSTTIHEATHNMTGNKGNKRIDNITKELFGGAEGLSELHRMNPDAAEHINYFADPTEVYARVMQLRHQFKLKPGQLIDDNLANKIYNAGLDRKTFVDKNFFNMIGINKYPTQAIKKVFNTLPVLGGAAIGLNKIQGNSDR